VGRKLLSTGNGRCNLTNTGAAPENYHGAAPGLCRTALEKYPPEKVLEFFASWAL
jgi:predicted flavoprotein YhiN